MGWGNGAEKANTILPEHLLTMASQVSRNKEQKLQVKS